MSDFEHSELENILDEAIQRVESGERLDSVLLAYPEKYRAELREMLSVVNAFEQIVAEPVPLPSASTRAISKQNFLASAKELKQAETPVSQAQLRARTQRAMAMLIGPCPNRICHLARLHSECRRAAGRLACYNG